MTKMKKMLLVVDPQIDFITGTLPVPDAEKQMDELAQYIAGQDGTYVLKVITTDWHPYDHHSFVSQGGEWPIHCVRNTIGAAIYPALIEPLYTTKGAVKVLRKGVFRDREEYSIFHNLSSAECLKGIIDMAGIGQIDICGIAGDICVLNTLKDGIEIFGKEIFNVLLPYCPSLDGGVALQTFVDNLTRDSRHG